MELMVTLAVATILVSLTYPSYQQYVIKSRRADAKGALQSFANEMERHYTVNGSYLGAGTLNSNNDGPPSIFATQAPLDGGTPYYNLTIRPSTGGTPETTADTFVLRATPISGTTQEDDGYMEITHTNLKRWDANNDGDTADSGEDKWQ